MCIGDVKAMSQPRRAAHRSAVVGVLWSCVLALVALTWLVQTGRAYWWWDFALAHLAARSADSYTHTGTLVVYRALNVPGDLRVDAVLTLAAVLVLARRRAGWATLLPLLLLATAPVEYAAKDLVYSPPPTPEVVLRPSAADALPYYTQQSPASCPAAVASPLGLLDDVSCPGGSFLSGAAARIVIVAGVALWWTARRRWRVLPRLIVALTLVAYALAAGVGRVYLRWHWPSDVIGGYLLGAILLCIILLVAQPRRAPRTVAPRALALLGQPPLQPSDGASR